MDNKKIEILNNDQIDDAIKIFGDLFDNNYEFANFFYNEYKQNCIYYGGFLNDQLVFITTIVQKRIFLNNEKQKCYLIVGVGTKKNFQGQGLMKFFLNEIINLQPKDVLIFIQSKNWKLYSSFNFSPCTTKTVWVLRKDQILHNKKEPILPTLDYDLMNKIRNIFIKNNKIENFTYRTSKENKKILKMLLIDEYKIYHTNRAYIIVGDDYVVDFAYIELIDLIKLLSNFDFGLKIKSFIKLDKRYFSEIDEPIVETKVLSNEKISIDFSEFF